ncbi:cobalt-precorrin-6A reductase [Celeribacter indicus]|uniref:Precorrin-6x reductase n=1 Tax=Celeribacter indicus TaxID=1208324 RepID=A0A0B5DWV1_9RHOB|nr:cobalt-precorrin-6A reductase [Celeribacter indicus]AJE45201.1 precorrin-6x reductase [Celeribacter indicus]SDX45208.1 precorrin-6A reductase [Celeribacter indicus]
MTRTLLLGGTSEASALASALAARGADAIFSYAGRTGAPKAQPLPTRTGGFGGVPGLVAYLSENGISHVIDATHPFAARMSRNALTACAAAGVELCSFERSPWRAGPVDRWTHVPDLAGAVAALPENPARVFLAIGKQHLTAFAARPDHHYLLRLVDPPEGPLPLPQAEAVVARGPFTVEEDLALLQSRGISLLVAKNAGGTGAWAKMEAARLLSLPVIVIDRPALPPRHICETVAQCLDWLDHGASAKRGV